ncbi:MAG: SUMF1/EgtB/PvdO family nonheme iron enzyme [Chloroflexota bacterium]
MRPLRVFLCHASQDKPAVRKLHRYLKQRGVQPWLDELDLLPGENWEVEIPNALFASDVILVCLSKNSVDKEGYVQKEITFALDKAQEKPEGTIFIIPVKLEDCDVPPRLNRYQWVDLFRADGYKRLLLGLNKRALGLAAEVSPVLLAGESGPKLAPKAEIAPPDIERLEAQKAEQAARERAEREAAETVAFEQAAREAQEKADRLASEREAARREEQAKSEREASRTPAPASPSPRGRGVRGEGKPAGKPAPKSPLRSLVIGGLVALLLLCGGLGLNYLINNMPVPTETKNSPTKTAASAPATSTLPPTEPHLSTPTPLPMLSEKDGMVMVYVPAGEFTMGSDSGDTDEKPAHTVSLDAFWIDQTEVTNKMYALCVEAGVCDPPKQTSSDTRDSYYGNPDFDDYPVIYMDWNRAKTYCEWAGRRLPTEAEWEKAARGVDGFVYPWGNEFDGTKTNFCDKNCTFNWANQNFNDGYVDTAPVGSYESGRSPYGVYDMAGNVWEWTADWYGENYYSTSPLENPLGPDSGDARVLRGGSWNYDSSYVRAANRNGVDPSSTDSILGFRCSRSSP